MVENPSLGHGGLRRGHKGHQDHKGHEVHRDRRGHGGYGGHWRRMLEVKSPELLLFWIILLHLCQGRLLGQELKGTGTRDLIWLKVASLERS